MELDGGSSKGLLLPRMRKQDIDAIQNPAEGLTIYATDEQAVYLRKSLVWEKQAPFTLPGDYSINFINTALRIQNSGDGDAILGTVQGAGTGVKGYGGGLGSYGVEGVSNSIGGAGGVFYNNFSGATALATTKGRVGLGTLFPIAQLHINGQYEVGTTVLVDDDNDPTIQFANSGVYRSYIKQEGNNLIFRPNAQNSSGKVVIQSYNDGGWLFVDAAGNTSLGIDPIGFTGTPYNSRMNIRSTTGVNLTLDAPSDNISGPVLSFINKSGPNTISELGRIKTNNTGIDIFSVGKTNFDGAGDWTWNTPSAFQPLMELRKYQYSADLLVSARVGIGGDFTYSHKDPMAALDINISSGINGNNTEAISIAGTDPIIRIKNHAVEKGFIQLVGNDMKVGTFATNDLGNFVIRTNGSDRIVVRPDGKMVLGSPTGSAPVSNHLLAVKGRIAATEFTVTALVSWPDYVFAPGYQLKSLEETAAYIKANNHLPNIPAAEVIEKEGFGLGEMQKLMMEKIEELTLHLIAADKEIQLLKKQMAERK